MESDQCRPYSLSPEVREKVVDETEDKSAHTFDLNDVEQQEVCSKAEPKPVQKGSSKIHCIQNIGERSGSIKSQNSKRPQTGLKMDARRTSLTNSSPSFKKKGSLVSNSAYPHSVRDKTEFFNNLVHVLQNKNSLD